jgi:phosphate transport system substrate-binding protein
VPTPIRWSTKQANRKIAKAIKRFLLWAIAPDETNGKYLEDAHFIPLPTHIWVLSHDQIEMIKQIQASSNSGMNANPPD